jgi:hypothetical protein
MNQGKVLQGLLVLWAIWEIINGVLSTVAPAAGASLVGWQVTWTPDLVSMSTQYGMILLLLGGVYLLAASDVKRYQPLVWVVVAEQVLALLYSAYLTFGTGTMTTSQFLTQAVINVIVAALFGILANGSGGLQRGRTSTV